MSKNVRFLFWSAALFSPVGSALGATGMTVTLDRRDTGTTYPLSMEFWVRGTLTGDASQGLAGFAFDLMGEAVEIASGEPVASFDVSAAVVTLSSAPAMPSFAPNLGFSNPGGFAGTAVGSQRRQIGGAQNTMGNDGTLYPFPAGAVVKTVGQPGPQVLAIVTLTIPTPPTGQKYVITAHNFVGSVLDPMQDGPTYKSTMLDEVGAVSIDAVLNGACCFEAGNGECHMRPEHECGQFLCNVADLLPDKFKGCHGDVDGNGVVNSADRGFVSASTGATAPSALCMYDLDGNGFINAADRGFVSAATGLCTPLPNFQNGSGCNGPNCPDPRFTGAGYTGNYIGDGSDCASLPCSGGGGG